MDNTIDNRIIQIYLDCFESKHKKCLDSNDLAELKPVIDMMTPKRHTYCTTDLVDIILVKMINRSYKFHEQFEFTFEFMQYLMDARFVYSENNYLLLSFIMICCSMEKEPLPNTFNQKLRITNEIFFVIFSSDINFVVHSNAFTGQLFYLKSIILNNDVIISGFSSLLKMSDSEVRSVIDTSEIWAFSPSYFIDCLGFVFPKGIALNSHIHFSRWPEGVIVELIIHELAHFLLRRKNGVYDAFFSTGESKLTRSSLLQVEPVQPDLEVLYVKESGCFVAEKIVGPILHRTSALKKYPADILLYSNTIMENLKNNRQLPLVPTLPESLRVFVLTESNYWCTGGLCWEEPMTRDTTEELLIME